MRQEVRLGGVGGGGGEVCAGGAGGGGGGFWRGGGAGMGYGMVSRPDLLVLMSQEAFTKYGSAVAEGAQLIVDTDLVESAAGKEWLRDIPATPLAAELGNRMVANVIMLGFLSAATGVVRREALEE